MATQPSGDVVNQIQSVGGSVAPTDVSVAASLHSASGDGQRSAHVVEGDAAAADEPQSISNTSDKVTAQDDMEGIAATSSTVTVSYSEPLPARAQLTLRTSRTSTIMKQQAST